MIGNFASHCRWVYTVNICILIVQWQHYVATVRNLVKYTVKSINLLWSLCSRVKLLFDVALLLETIGF